MAPDENIPVEQALAVLRGATDQRLTLNTNNSPARIIGALADMQRRVKEINVANGWFDSDRTFGEDMVLLHSEVSEAFEAYRSYGTDDVTQWLCKTYDHAAPGGVEGAHLCKPEGVGSEFADILIRLLDSCERYDIDLEAEVERKLEYNKTRGYRHGGKKV